MATQELVAADPMSTVHRYIDAFSEGDVKGMAAAFAVAGSILDGMSHTCGRYDGSSGLVPGCLDQH